MPRCIRKVDKDQLCHSFDMCQVPGAGGGGHADPSTSPRRAPQGRSTAKSTNRTSGASRFAGGEDAVLRGVRRDRRDDQADDALPRGAPAVTRETSPNVGRTSRPCRTVARKANPGATVVPIRDPRSAIRDPRSAIRDPRSATVHVLGASLLTTGSGPPSCAGRAAGRQRCRDHTSTQRQVIGGTQGLGRSTGNTLPLPWGPCEP